jgi:hypothetical protein
MSLSSEDESMEQDRDWLSDRSLPHRIIRAIGLTTFLSHGRNQFAQTTSQARAALDVREHSFEQTTILRQCKELQRFLGSLPRAW